jgi:hypothetical protein
VSRESFPHVLVARVLLVDKMVRCCYVVVSVCLQAPNRIVFFKAVVFNQPFEKILAEGHFLKSREKTRLTLATLVFFDSISHVRVTSNIRYTVASLGVCVQYLTDNVLALRR